MNEEPDNRELAKRFELLKKDYEIMQANIDNTLNTMQANIDNTLNTMQVNIEGTLKELRTDIERNNTEAAKRETRLILTIVGLLVAGIAIQGFLLN